MKPILSSIILLLVPAVLSAQGPAPRWEYFVISQEDALHTITESGQDEAYKTWLAANRPDAHRKITELDAQEAAADNARKKLKSFVSTVSNSRLETLSKLNYYLNLKGQENWELVSTTDATLIFKRLAQ